MPSSQTSWQRVHPSAFLPPHSQARRWLVIPLLVVLSLVLIPSEGLALTQNTSSARPNLAAEQLTHTLMTLSVQYQLAGPSEQVRLLGPLINVAATRQLLLAALIEDDPAGVLRVAIPSGIRGNLPSAAQLYVEEEEELRGVLEVLHEDRDPGSRFLYALEVAGQRFSLHFAADPPALLTGTRVRVTGVRVGQALALQSGSSSVQVLAVALPNTFGAQNTLVMLVNFQDKATQPYTLDSARGVVFTTTSNYDLENSYGQTSLTGDVVGWYTIALSYTVCDYYTLASLAEQAATAAGVNISAYSRRVYAFPNNACSWWGLGTVGGNPSKAWINGSFQLLVVGHEMGHNFGLYHSRALECGSATLGTSCSTIEYGDTLDIMGDPQAGHFNAFQKERLGWLNYGSSPPITTVEAGGTYALDPYESDLSGANALKILKSTDPTTGKRTWYYVEYRQAYGFDSFLSSNTNVLKGVVIHTGSEASANSSYLLDMTPATSSWSDPALDVGQSLYDPDSGVTMAPVSVASSGAAVSVSFGPLTCTRANPSVAVSPSATQWVQAGASVSYTVSVTNNDNAGCTASSFTLQAAVSDASGILSGWTASFGASVLTISPGASASTTLTITSPVGTADGFYTIGVTATNSVAPAYVGSASVTVNIVSGLTVTVQASTRKQGATLTAHVSLGGAPVANASVTFTITKPGGVSVKKTATTGTTGDAVSNYQLKRTDPVGTYSVTADANWNGMSGNSESISFTVQ